MNSYASISSFGSNAHSDVNNPLTYCLNDNMDQRFLHGSNADIYGQHSRPCQLFLSEYCANGWDSFCEAASLNTNSWTPNNMQCCLLGGDVACRGLNAGEVLIQNTAARKYLVKMFGAKKAYEPFDPNVATSPLISYWVPDNGCPVTNSYSIPVYAVDPKTIDNDPVMDKILAKPGIAATILVNIYNTMKRMGTLSELKGTKLGYFYMVTPYFKAKGGV